MIVLCLYLTTDPFFCSLLSFVAKKFTGIPMCALLANKRYELLYNCGIQLLHIGRPLAAFECLIEAVQVYHSNPRLWLRLAECCISANKGVCQIKFLWFPFPSVFIFLFWNLNICKELPPKKNDIMPFKTGSYLIPNLSLRPFCSIFVVWSICFLIGLLSLFACRVPNKRAKVYRVKKALFSQLLDRDTIARLFWHPSPCKILFTG